MNVPEGTERRVTVRYWAALRSAAGTSEQLVHAGDLAEALNDVRCRYGAESRFTAVLDICAIVVDGTPAGSRDHADIPLRDGSVVELLPPFAGG